jgi:membrane-associated phospholipid phosphatase
MKAGSKTYLFVGIAGGFVSVVNLAELLSGQGNLIDVLALVFFAILSAEGFISYLRIKGKTEFHLIS